MLYSLKANIETFKNFEFQSGLNIILADRQKVEGQSDSPEKRSRNGAGKSSVVDIIHFLLAGKPEGAIKSTELLDWSFNLTLDVGDEVWRIDRKISEPKSITAAKVIPPGETFRFTASSLAQQLGETWFGLSDTIQPGAASFRQLISYFARRRRDGGYDAPVRTFRAQNNAVTETNLAVLFGLDAEIVRRFHQAKEALKQNELAQKALRTLDKSLAPGARRVDLEAQLSAQIAAFRFARDSLAEKIASFNVLPVFRQLEKELAELNRYFRDFSDQDVLDAESIDANHRALESEDASQLSHLKLLFDEANFVIPETVTRRYDEVEKFHQKLIENRKSHLENEIASAQRRISDRHTEREQLEVRRRNITNALRSSGPADELLRLRDELSEKQSLVRALEAKLGEARRLDLYQEELKVELETAIKALRQDRRERSSIVDHASRTFSEISERLYETPGQLAISATELGLHFLPSTPSDQSAGVMSMEIFCFDFTIATLCKSKGLGPDFLFHDSHLFEAVDGRQFAKALRFASKFSKETGFQYIVALNSD